MVGLGNVELLNQFLTWFLISCDDELMMVDVTIKIFS